MDVPNDAFTLLVVDDTELNRDMLSRRLIRQDYKVELANDGRIALDMIIADPDKFDLILLDIMMPEMDGYEVLEYMKASDELRHIPVIVISALEEVQSVVRCIKLGAEDYLNKPFDPTLLKARVGASLEKKWLRDQEKAYRQQLEAEKKRSDELLHVILPHEVVVELKATNTVKPRRVENVSVLFCDIVGFTAYSADNNPEVVVAHLQQLVGLYEDLALRYDMEKIKTIGDSFMATAGLLGPVDNPALNCVVAGIEMIQIAGGLEANWQVRVGVHIGPVIAGVVGNRQFLFDLWGDTVNTAARLESYGIPGTVNVSAQAWSAIEGLVYGESRGLVTVKGKGDIEMFRVDGLQEIEGAS